MKSVKLWVVIIIAVLLVAAVFVVPAYAECGTKAVSCRYAVAFWTTAYEDSGYETRAVIYTENSFEQNQEAQTNGTYSVVYYKTDQEGCGSGVEKDPDEEVVRYKTDSNCGS